MRIINLLFFMFSLVLVSACGGGGSGGGSKGSGTAGSFSVNTTTVDFTGRIGQNPPEAVAINGTLTNAKSDPYILVDTSHTNLIESAYLDLVSSTQGRLVIIPNSPNNITPGSHSGVIKVSVCKDSACKQHYSGSPIDINVNYVVTAPEYQVTPTSLTFDMYENQPLPESQFLSLTSSESEYFLIGASYSSYQNWLGLDLDPFRHKVFLFVTKSLPAGTYSGNANVYAFSSVISKSVGVTLNVKKLPVQLSNLNWDAEINTLSFSGSEAKEITLTSAEGAVNWTAESNVEWLSVGQSSGSATSVASAFTVMINQNVLKLRSGNWVGKISIQGEDTSIPPSVYTVNLKLNKPEISAIGPAVGLVGQAYKVNIYGKKIGMYTSEIRVDGQVPDSIVELAEDTVQVILQPVEEGNIEISVGDGLSDYPSRKAVFTAKSISSSLPESQLDLADMGSMAVFDAIHEELYILAHHPQEAYGPNTRIQKLFLQDGVWTLADIFIENCRVLDMNLSPDAAQLAILCGQYNVAIVDTNTLSLKSRVKLQDRVFGIGAIAFRNNFELLMATSDNLSSYDLSSDNFNIVEAVNTDTNLYHPKLLSSADRSTFYILQNGLSPAPLVKRFDTFENKLFQTTFDESHYGMESTSLDGKWTVLGDGLYDQDMTLKGQVIFRQLSLSGDIGWGIDFSDNTIKGYSLQNISLGDYSPVKSFPFSLSSEGSLFIFTSVNNKRLFIVRGYEVAVVNVE